MDAFEVLAHRGTTSPHVPENTLAAVDAALDAGADGVEVDVRLTADRVAVCLHDADLRRVAGLAVLVERTAFAQLRRVPLPGGHVVPTLREVAAAVAGRGRLVVDIKPEARLLTLTKRVLQAVDGMPYDDVVVSSFSPAVLEEARRREPARQRALIATGDLRAVPDLARSLDCRAVHLDLRSLLLPGPAGFDSLDAATRAGLATRVWTVDRPTDAGLLERVGALGVLTDDVPALLRARVAG